jgi:methyl-accepting chemotaxis protein
MAQKGINFKITAVNKTKQAFSSIGRGLKGITKAVFNFKTALTGAVGIAGMGLLIRNSLIATDRLGKMSGVLGIAVKDLQTLKLASEINGIEFETFAKATRRLVDNFGDFLQGTGEATQTFKALGISIKDANAVNGDQMAILGLIADRLDLVENKTMRLKFAQEIFGGRGAELINVLRGGTEALKKFAIESDRFGSLNSKQVRAVEEFNDSVLRLKTVFANIVNQLVANVSPAFLKLSRAIREKVLSSIEDANGSIQQFASVGAKDLIDFGIKAIQMFESLVQGIGDFRVSLLRAIEVIQHPFSKKNRKQIDDYTFSLQKLIETLEGFKANVDVITDSVKEQNKSLENVGDTANKLKSNYTGVQDRLERLKNASEQFGNSVAGNFEKAVFEARNFRDTLKAIGQDIIKIAYQTAITKPMGEALGGIISGGISGVQDIFFPKKAMGGAVTGGKSYMVGERGAEIFTPNKSGYITPNNKIGGQDSIRVVQEINIMPSVSETARAEIFGMLPLIKQEALNGVMDARNRGGSFARALGVKA